MSLKRKYLAGPDDSKQKGKAWRGRRAGGSAGGNAGKPRRWKHHESHPLGLSGRTLANRRGQ